VLPVTVMVMVKDLSRRFAGLSAAAASNAGPAATRATISFPTTATTSGGTRQPQFGCWLVAVRAPGSRQHSSPTGTAQAAIGFNPPDAEFAWLNACRSS
jgi:hypothetical protein